jgi:hypothetical protein
MSIPIIIYEGASGSPATFVLRKGEAGLFRDVGKRTIAVVAIKFILSKIRAEEIFESVVVIVAYADGVSPSNMVQTGFVSDISEGSITVIFVKTVGGTGRCPVEPFAGKKKDVHPSIIVVVNECTPAAISLKDVFFMVYSPVNDWRRQPGTFPDVDEMRIKRAARRRGPGLLF